jgi:Ca2+-binding RTX toxin-like protein
MSSFTLTSSTAVTATQFMTLGSDTGFIGTLASLVTGPSVAIDIDANASGAFVVNYGAIVSTSRVVLADASFRLINDGLIACEGIAISQNIPSSTLTSTTIQNTGSILSSAGSAIQITDSGARITNDGVISGYEYGIQVGSFGAADINEITNSGTISVQLESGFAIAASNALRLVNTGEIIGSIVGSSQGDDIDTRSGTITGNVILGDGANLFRGSAGEDSVSSGSGSDTLRGNGGDDHLTSQGGGDFLFGGRDDDVLSCSSGTNQMFGGSGDDTLFGGSGKDELRGGAGNDILVGGNGRDSLYGGAGEDEFRFVLASDSDLGQSPDKIFDFERGSDVINLSALPGTLTFAGQGALTGGGTSSVAYTKAGGVLTVQVDTDGDGTANMEITVLGAGQLTAADFLL